MRRFLLWCSPLALALITPAAPGVAGASVSVGIYISNAPPPPVVVWHREPTMVLIRGSSVYCYPGDLDYDYFRYGMYYYAYHDDCWYRARYWRGPYRAIHASYVPRAFYALHDRGYHWRHRWHGIPPGHAKNMVPVAERHGHGHGKGHGHGHGHDKDD